MSHKKVLHLSKFHIDAIWTGLMLRLMIMTLDDKVGHHVSKESKSPDEVDGPNIDPRFLGEVRLGWSHHCCHETVTKLKMMSIV